MKSQDDKRLEDLAKEFGVDPKNEAALALTATMAAFMLLIRKESLTNKKKAEVFLAVMHLYRDRLILATLNQIKDVWDQARKQVPEITLEQIMAMFAQAGLKSEANSRKIVLGLTDSLRPDSEEC